MERPTVLVFGSSGQVAAALKSVFPAAVFVPSSECDFSSADQIAITLDRIRPSLIINPAAYTAVDTAEDEREQVFRINAEAPAEIALWCAQHRSSLVHFSTDYVYGGGGNQPFSESDPVKPLNVYGESKLAGEVAIAKSGCHHLILRTSWVYSFRGKNFVRTMARLGQSNATLKIVNDQIGAPTYAPDIARTVALICGHRHFKSKTGIYNLANSGETSWYNFAKEIFAGLNAKGESLAVKNVVPITSAEYPTKATRPLNSRLGLDKVKNDFGVSLREWHVALKECLAALE